MEKSVHPQINSICKCLLKVDADVEFNNELILIPNEVSEIRIGDTDGIVNAIIEETLLKMKLNESKDVTLPLHVKEDTESVTKCSLELLSFTAGKYSFEMDVNEKLDLIEHHKDTGNIFFKEGKISLAFSRYSRASKFLVTLGNAADLLMMLNPTDYNKWKTLYCGVFLNMSICQLKHNYFDAVVKNTSSVIKVDSSNIKALYRRAQGYSQLGQLNFALIDLENATKLDAKNSAIKTLLCDVKNQLLNV